MSKFKICPDCGRCNPPGRIECEECEADLTAVPLTDGEAQENTAHSAAVQPEPPAKPRPVRICACGTENPAAARVCASCGEDISDIIPTAPGNTLRSCRLRWKLGARADFHGDHSRQGAGACGAFRREAVREPRPRKAEHIRRQSVHRGHGRDESHLRQRRACDRETAGAS